MKIHALLVGSFLVVASALTATGCGSSTSSGSGGGSGSGDGVFCSYTNPGTTFTVCTGAAVSGTGDDSAYINAQKSACTNTLKGKIVDSCPDTNVVGCCQTSESASGVSSTSTTCYYKDSKLTEADVKMGCVAPSKFVAKP